MKSAPKARLTTGPISRTLVNLTAPMVLGMLGMTAFNLADTYFIGQLGTAQLAAMSFTFPVVMTIGSLAQGLGVGASAVISRAIGEGDPQKVKRLTSAALLLSLLVVAVFALIGVATIDSVFRFLGASPDVLPLIRQYMTIWYLGVIAVVIPQVGNNAIRATGDTKTPSMVMLVAVVVNIVLDPLLIFGLGPFPRLELAGGALASVIARSVTLLVALWILYAREKMIALTPPRLKDLMNSWKQILYIGLPTATTNMMVPLSAGLITKLIATYGAAAVAAFGVASRLESFALLVVMALVTVLSPFVGQNWGAKEYERAETGVRYSERFSMLWGLAMVVVLGLTGGLLAPLFNNNPEVVAVVKTYFWILPVSYGLYGVLKLATVVLSVLNRPLRSATLTLTRTFALYIPLAYLGSELFGLPGIFGAASLSYILVGIGAYLWLKKTLVDSMEYDYLQRVVEAEKLSKQPASLGYWVARLNRLGQRYYNQSLSTYNLDTRTLSFLTTLLHGDGLSPDELSDKLVIHPALTRRAVSTLGDLDYVRRDDSGNLFVTQKARDIAPHIKSVLQSWSDTLSEGFTDAEKQMALTLLERMNANAR